MLSSDFRKNIKELRKSEAMTQAELAKRIGASEQMIGKWETGQTQVISVDYIIKIANVFKISTDELLTGIKPKNVTLSNQLHLSDAAIDELCASNGISEIINLLLNPDYCYLDVPLGHQLLFLIRDSIIQDCYLGDYSIGTSSNGKEIKSYITSSEINLIHMKHLIDELRKYRQDEKSRRLRQNETGKR